MGIDADWIDERGGLLDRVEDTQMLLARLVGSSAVDGTTCLRFLDPCGETYFNQLQIPVLINELEALLAHVPTSEEKLHLVAVLKLARGARGATHTYLRFSGD